jgi:hypothetical protein
MKKKSSRRRIEIDLEELDQVIDRATCAPLAESDARKLKTALHAMAERLKPKRTTEKTSAVAPGDSSVLEQPEPEGSAPAGHGRHSAAAFANANRVPVLHLTLHSGRPLSGLPQRKNLPAERTRNAGTYRGTSATYGNCV